MKRILLLLMTVFSPLLSQGQGLVNVNNRGLSPVQLVYDNAGNPLVGTQYVAQIVYGPGETPLGDPMPFRVSTTSSPGTWNPGTNSLRTLNGYVEGQTVSMRVWVWDSSIYSSLAQVRASVGNGDVGWSCGTAGTASYGVSQSFHYTVGNPSSPATLALANFRSFQTEGLNVWGPSYVLDSLGGAWVGRIDATENSESVPVNLLNVPPVQTLPFAPPYSPELPPGTHGGEPVGWAIRSITAGNPLILAIPTASSWGMPQTAMGGFTETVGLATNQSSAETSLVSVEGTVSDTIIRLKRPFIGRVILQFRYPLDPQLPPGCVSAPRNLVVDLKPVNTPVRMAAVGNIAPGLRLKLEPGPTHVISRSFDLATWETVGTYSVGYPMCIPQVGPPSCGIWGDLDGVGRFGDFTIPIQNWLPAEGTQKVFFRLQSF